MIRKDEDPCVGCVEVREDECYCKERAVWDSMREEAESKSIRRFVVALLAGCYVVVAWWIWCMIIDSIKMWR